MLRILIVDPDPEFARALASCARGRGHDPKTVSTSVDAASLLAVFRPHLVIADVGTRESSGEELAVMVKWQTDARVLLYHSEPLPADRVLELRAKSDSFLPKHRLFWAVSQLPRVTDTRKLRRPRVPVLRGQFDEKMPLAETVAGLEFNRKSGLLKVWSDDGEGWMSFKEGAPHEARFQKLEGDAAIRAMLELAQGSFEVDLATPAGERRIAESFARLLFDHARRQDETARDAAEAAHGLPFEPEKKKSDTGVIGQAA